MSAHAILRVTGGHLPCSCFAQAFALQSCEAPIVLPTSSRQIYLQCASSNIMRGVAD